mmetsp:Transcript_8680/g.20499  ORF Transcript_8680/g.20499 Transcript_8680/m.20499 type:complete len:440 (+) Transcript_8680:1107-2426(+)
MHQRERLLHFECPFNLAQAVLGLEVALGDEDHDHRRLLDVLLEGADVLEVVDVEEDRRTRQQQAELPLDRGALVLAGAPDVREEEVPLVVRGERELRPLARREEAEGGHPRGVDDGLDGEHDGEGHRAEDADEEAAADDELVEVEAVVQLARLERLRDGLDLEHGAEEEDGREREVARDREVVVLLLAVGRGDGGDEHEDHREDHRHAQLHDGVVAHADHDAHEEELLELLGDLPAVHARLEVAVQEGERRGEARGPIRADGLARRHEQQQVEQRDADRVEEDCEVGEAHGVIVVGAAALDAQVVTHEALDVGRRARQGRVVGVVLGDHLELDAGPRPEGDRRDGGEGEEGDDRDGGQRHEHAPLGALLELGLELGLAHRGVHVAVLLTLKALRGAPVEAQQQVPLLAHVVRDERRDDDDGPQHHEGELAIVAAEPRAL